MSLYPKDKEHITCRHWYWSVQALLEFYMFTFQVIDSEEDDEELDPIPGLPVSIPFHSCFNMDVLVNFHTFYGTDRERWHQDVTIDRWKPLSIIWRGNVGQVPLQIHDQGTIIWASIFFVLLANQFFILVVWKKNKHHQQCWLFCWHKVSLCWSLIKRALLAIVSKSILYSFLCIIIEYEKFYLMRFSYSLIMLINTH